MPAPPYEKATRLCPPGPPDARALPRLPVPAPCRSVARPPCVVGGPVGGGGVRAARVGGGGGRGAGGWPGGSGRVAGRALVSRLASPAPSQPFEPAPSRALRGGPSPPIARSGPAAAPLLMAQSSQESRDQSREASPAPAGRADDDPAALWPEFMSSVDDGNLGGFCVILAAPPGGKRSPEQCARLLGGEVFGEVGRFIGGQVNQDPVRAIASGRSPSAGDTRLFRKVRDLPRETQRAILAACKTQANYRDWVDSREDVFDGDVLTIQRTFHDASGRLQARSASAIAFGGEKKLRHRATLFGLAVGIVHTHDVDRTAFIPKGNATPEVIDRFLREARAFFKVPAARPVHHVLQATASDDGDDAPAPAGSTAENPLDFLSGRAASVKNRWSRPDGGAPSAGGTGEGDGGRQEEYPDLATAAQKRAPSRRRAYDRSFSVRRGDGHKAAKTDKEAAARRDPGGGTAGEATAAAAPEETEASPAAPPPPAASVPATASSSGGAAPAATEAPPPPAASVPAAAAGGPGTAAAVAVDNGAAAAAAANAPTTSSDGDESYSTTEEPSAPRRAATSKTAQASRSGEKRKRALRCVIKGCKCWNVVAICETCGVAVCPDHQDAPCECQGGHDDIAHQALRLFVRRPATAKREGSMSRPGTRSASTARAAAKGQARRRDPSQRQRDPSRRRGASRRRSPERDYLPDWVRRHIEQRHADHERRDVAPYTRDHALRGDPPGGYGCLAYRYVRRRGRILEVCQKFNVLGHGGADTPCADPRCRRHHACLICGADGHGAHECEEERPELPTLVNQWGDRIPQPALAAARGGAR